MFAKDFVFDGQKASDYDLIICSFDGELQAASGGEAEYNVVKPPDSDTYSFYGAQYNSVLEWSFSIMKNPCNFEDEDLFLSKHEQRQIIKWLQRRDNYHWFSFIEEDDEEEICYKVTINMVPHQINGKTIGFDLIVTANSRFGFSPLIKRKAIINKNSSLILYVDTDTNNYILPVVTISSSTGELRIKNTSDYSAKDLKITVDGNQKIRMDAENEIVTGLTDPNYFNWSFLRLVDGKNVFTTTSENDIEIEFIYREVRSVIV